MKTTSRTLLFLALAAASAAASAQRPHSDDAAAKAAGPHAGHHRHARPTAADPHAQHKDHAAHAVSKAATVPDPHAGHAMQSTPANDPHAGDDDHGNHTASGATDPHAGHRGHAAHGQAAGQDAHAGHDMHAAPTLPDPHAGHAMTPRAGAAPLQTPHTPIPVPTAEDVAAAFPTVKPHAMQHAPAFNNLVVFDHLEAWDNAHGSGQSWSIDAWFGNDIDRLWLRSDGERADGHAGSWSLDALYGRSISPWWDVVAGVRREHNHEGPDLTRAAIGLQGLAPYKFDISATAYLGGPRKAELAVEAEYDVLLTNRLILQPVLEANLVADDDPRRGTGSGLSHVEAGLRLRYEVTRRFAPYVGFVHERRFGRTADLHRDAGEGVRDSRWVAGVRFWF